MKKNMQRCGSRNWQELVIQKKILAAAAEGENYEWTDMYDELCKNGGGRRFP